MQLSRAVVALPVVLTLGLTLGGTAAFGDPPRPDRAATSVGGSEQRARQAEDALARVDAIRAGAPHDLTLALRDLVLLKDALPADQRRAADHVLARPAATKRSCTKNICVHYATSGPNRPSLRDRNRNHVPDFVDKVRTTVNAVHLRYKKAGYRTPLRDNGAGGDNRTDIYLRNIGAHGDRGYCTSDDDPRRQRYLWAYCVFDNDYSPRQYGKRNSPLQNLQLAAAHEYFHAVQFAYDATEDDWILESTATWMEDELYDRVDDSRKYLRNSPMSSPTKPLDSSDSTTFDNGTWIFWRYLTEEYPNASAGLPTLVRAVWRRLDARRRAPDDYSLQGLENVLADRGTNLTKELAFFADANRHPADVYEEGGTYRIFAPDQVRTLSAAAPGPVGGSKQLDHLSSFTVRFVPHSTLTGSGWQLNLHLDLSAVTTQPAAMVTRFKRDGTVKTQRVNPGPTGVADLTVPQFDDATYRYVEVTLVNASDRFNCGVDNTEPFYSCAGRPLDDNEAASVTGTATPVPTP